MKKLLLRTLLILLSFLYSIYSWSQPGKDARDCSTTCFTSEVISQTALSETCTAWELKVSVSGPCEHALSHYTVEVPCGTVKDISNSRGWKQETGKDPTSGLQGFKIDDIEGFGKKGGDSFIVRFTHCQPANGCDELGDCWQPRVAYKASTCVNYETLNVVCESPVLDAVLVKEDVSCGNASDGTLEVVVNQGKEPFHFAWADGSTERARTNLAPGTYTVIVTDASGSSVTLEETISSAEALAITGSVTAPECGVSNGAIDVSVTGGVAPYTFMWSQGATTEDLSELTPGLYTVNVTDASGCTAERSFVVLEAKTLALSGIVSQTDCSDNASGAIDLSVRGGVSPYTFRWSNDSTTEDLKGLSAGMYTVVVTDANGCEASSSFNVTRKSLDISRGVTPSSCFGSDDGSIVIQEPADGTAPFEYQWSDGGSGSTRTGLKPGLYTVTVTDATGCSTPITSLITEPAQIAASAVVTFEGCEPNSIANVNLTVSGGTAPYEFQWSDGSTNQNITDVPDGVHTVEITDSRGCTFSMAVPIERPQDGGEPLACVIESPSEDPICGSPGNTLSSTVDAADSYHWTVQSADNSWVIVGTSGNTVTYTAGSPGTTATFTLTVSKGGCSETCTYTLTTCTPTETPDPEEENPGEENPGDESDEEPDDEDPGQPDDEGGSPEEPGDEGGSPEEPGDDPEKPGNGDGDSDEDEEGNEEDEEDEEDEENPGGDDDTDKGDETEGTCATCFASVGKLIQVSGSCRTYEIEVSTDGLCRHDLSHWTIAVPCGTISNVWNSANWPTEIGKDPTTGLSGLKVDEINRFGKVPGSFTVRFTLCDEGNCDLSTWAPVVAYKAGQCVSSSPLKIDETDIRLTVSAYPNPFTDVLTLSWKSDHVTGIQILDQYGNVLESRTHTGSFDESVLTLQTSHLPRGIYYYRLTSGGRTYNGKITKR